jgi:hypothetical protein
LIDELQDMKTVFYKEIIEQVATARPGVLELMDAAIAEPSLKVGIDSISAAYRLPFPFPFSRWAFAPRPRRKAL